MDNSKLPTQFGIFYPTGWIVAAFDDELSAKQVQRDLFTGGYDAEDCRLVTGEEIVPLARGQLEDADWLSRLGKADEMVAKRLDAALGGGSFLIIHAPTEPEVERVMTVVRRVPFQFAHSYRRFAIQTLS